MLTGSSFGLIRATNFAAYVTSFSVYSTGKLLNAVMIRGCLRNNCSVLTTPLSQLPFDNKKMPGIGRLIAVKTLCLGIWA